MESDALTMMTRASSGPLFDMVRHCAPDGECSTVAVRQARQGMLCNEGDDAMIRPNSITAACAVQ